ncbi:MAG: TlpA disulfide reductase family protein [Vicingaceae bacterium]
MKKWGHITMSLLFCFIMQLNYASLFAQVPTEITTYKWYKISEKDLRLFCNFSADILGNGIIKRKDSSIYVLAFDTLGLKINITTCDSTYKLELATKSNNYFNPKWENLSFGEVPTPLTKKEHAVFSIFSQYRILNEPISKFLPESFKANFKEGKIYLLNFWYYGCLPCMAEVPALNQLNEIYKEDKEVQIISFFRDSIIYSGDTSLYQTLTYSSSGAKYKPVAINLKVVPNSKEVNNRLNVRSYPTNLIIDKRGVIRKVFIGASISKEKNKDLVPFYKSEIEVLKGKY